MFEILSNLMEYTNTIFYQIYETLRDSYMASSFQVGVIRPISRDSDAGKRPGQELSNHSDLKLKKDELKENKSSPIHVKKNNKVSGSKQNNDDKKKETLIIEKDPVFVPVESWKENTQVFVQEKHNDDKIDF